MHRLAITLALATAIVSPVRAQEAPTFVRAAVADPSPALLAALAEVCTAGRFRLSDGATVACSKQTFPRLNRSGDAFANSAVGTELNTLIRQVAQ